MKPSQTQSPTIRLTGALMLLLTLVIPASLYLAQKAALQKTSATHRPQRMEAALATFEKAIRAGHAQVTSASILDDRLSQCAETFSKSGGANGFDSLADYLQTLNRRLAALGGGNSLVGNRLLRWEYSIDSEVWLEEANEGIKHRRFSCSDLLYAARWIAGPSGDKLLADARWTEMQRHRTANTAPPPYPVVTFPASSLAQSDPWKGWPGCIWLRSADSDEAWYIAPSDGSRWGRVLCEQEKMRPPGVVKVATAVSNSARPPSDRGDSGWIVPESLNVMLADLDALRIPSGEYYQNLTRSLGKDGNRHKFGRVELDIGYHVHLTIDPETQKRAQQIARCYTGDRPTCRLLNLDADTIGAGRVAGTIKLPGAKAMWEGAAARMTAIAVIDVASGRIEALASAHTDCYRQEYDGPGRGRDCPPLWTTPKHRPEGLLNHAVFEDYFPGSTVKPILASVFLEDGDPVDDVQRELAISASTAFLDRMFCVNKDSRLTGRAKIIAPPCDRPARIQKRASDLGWNLGCRETSDRDCAHLDLLFGRPMHRRPAIEPNIGMSRRQPLMRDILLGRTLVKPDLSDRDENRTSGFHLITNLSFDAASAKACASQRWDPKQPACKGIGSLGPLRSEGYGQGESRATPIGVAAMLGRLVAAAQGRSESLLPHLVVRLADVEGNPVQTIATKLIDGQLPLVRREPINLNAGIAQQVLAGMAMGARSGTGLQTCISVFGSPACLSGRTRFAGKTGTTSFNFDDTDLGRIRQHVCNSHTWGSECNQRPMKWYVAAYNSNEIVGKAKLSPEQESGHYDKVIAVLSERNWYSLKSAYPNRIHGLTNDGAVNISAEIGMRVMAGGQSVELK